MNEKRLSGECCLKNSPFIVQPQMPKENATTDKRNDVFAHTTDRHWPRVSRVTCSGLITCPVYLNTRTAQWFSKDLKICVFVQLSRCVWKNHSLPKHMTEEFLTVSVTGCMGSKTSRQSCMAILPPWPFAGLSWCNADWLIGRLADILTPSNSFFIVTVGWLSGNYVYWSVVHI